MPQSWAGRAEPEAAARTDSRAGETGESRESQFRVEAPTLSLPKGGGAIKSIDETYTVNPANGTVSLSLPLPFTPARGGFIPPVRVRYDSGAGNSVLGLGWSLEVPSIQRRTDARLPRYRDQDTFLFQGIELVPASTWNGIRWIADITTVGSLLVERFRPRIEGEFARIERITDAALGSWWRVCSRENVTTFFGIDDATRLADPSAADHIFSWLPAISFDDQGNCLVYEHKAENLASVSSSRADANRRNGIAPFTNRHLKRLRYGNRIPYFVNEATPYRPDPVAGTFLFEAVFDYGEHDPQAPTPAESPGRVWGARQDPFSSYRSGFDIRTYRLLQRVLMFHQFDEMANGQPTLVRSLDLEYVQAPEVTYLRSATQCGYAQKPDGSYARKALPPIELEYEPLQWHTAIDTVDRDSIANLPAGATGNYQWMDLYGESIAGLFTEQADAWFYKANLGDVDEDGLVRLDANALVVPKPSFAGMAQGSLQLRDLDGNGLQQLVVHTPELQGYFDRGPHGEWLPFRPFERMVRLGLDDAHVRRLDLDGDGRADLLIAEENAFLWYRGDKQGYEPAQRTSKPFDEERGPCIVFAEEQQTIFLADMTGDGQVDLVRIRNGDISYWPNLGYGRFGARVAMDRAPTFAPPDLFDARFLHLADVSGTGTSDILYLAPHRCDVYLNLSGNAWSEAQPIEPFFATEQPNQVTTTDLLGDGTTCIVWSSGLPMHAQAPMRYINLMGGRKPHLLRRYVNNLGKEVAFAYKSSTWFYLKDKVEGRPWITRLPFPVHCLRRVESCDRISGAQAISELRYHHGYFDRVEREFRGFGMVEQRDAETFEHWAKDTPGHAVDRLLQQPPVLTKTWFHTGAPSDRAEILTRFRDEYWDREMTRQGFAVAANEATLPDARLLAGPGLDPAVLSPVREDDWREALRSCKGMVLRREIFALDAPDLAASSAERQRQLSPYSVATHTCVIEMLQPVLDGQHAVFVVKDSEAVTWHYERALSDPRIEHTLNLVVDEYGNVRESATVVYGRQTPDPALPPETRDAQARTSILYMQTELTGDEIAPAHHRLRRPSRSSTFEIVGLTRGAPLYRLEDFIRPGFHVLINSTEIPFHEYASIPPAGVVQRRLVRRKETVFYDATLTAALPLHGLHYRALPFESYELAFTPDLLTHIFAGRATDPLLTEGQWIHRGDANWWVPSGRQTYLAAGEAVADARARFFVPVAHVDACGARTAIEYLSNYALLIEAVEDAAHNRTQITAFDLRVLKPTAVLDANGNISEAVYDELGWVKATALRGKGTEGDGLAGIASWPTASDSAAGPFFAATTTLQLRTAAATLLQHATMRFVHDVDRYRNSAGASPPVLATILREQHDAVAADSPLQLSFEYSNGMGKVELRKVQAEPLVPPELRWMGTGRKILNNKGSVVKEYEPFFSVTPAFETAKALVESGVTRLMRYDALNRRIRVDEPDGTFSRTDHTGWSVTDHDRNDTVLESAWYDRRIHRLIDAELIALGKDPAREAEAAAQTVPHAATPTTRHLDPFGRAILEIEHAGVDGGGQPILYPTRRVRDVEGAVRTVLDARGNAAMHYEFNMRGRVASYQSMDGGRRWMLDSVVDNPVRSWDERGHEFVFAYDDPLHRPTSKRVRGGDGPAPLDHLFERIVYGEGRPGDASNNLRGRVALIYDTAGRTEHVSYDFKGNLTASTRRFAADAKAVPNWAGADPDAGLLAEPFASSATYDALNRIARRVAADGSVYLPIYNEANLLEQVRVTQDGGTQVYVDDIDYDALGQRQRIVFGNGVSTTYAYDPETFRLLSLTSERADHTRLQELHYTYDPVGNATHVDDRAVPTIWFANAMITGLATYRYDPLYRLIQATGREHAGQIAAPVDDNWNDTAFRRQYSANDPLAWRNYIQQYRYDQTGNLSEVQHAAAAASWTRGYTYAPDSNRLTATQVGPTTFAYTHHAAHGFVTSMPHLTVMRWNFRDELQAVSTQAVGGGATPETTWYVYDGTGKRVRKITERQAAAGVAPARKSERYYLDGVEIYREYDGAAAPSLERTTFDVMDDRQCIARIEREGATRVVRYQGADHLSSSHVETDETGRVISFEEFHPFGTTAYQAVDKDIVAAAKRYRFTGMERDDESGLEYHAARYYAPWLGRWTAPDLHAEQLDGNRYAYVKNNPVINRDSNGMFEEPTHGILTYRLALAAGIPRDEAARIAIATAAMDHDRATSPAGVGQIAAFSHIGETERYHYPDRPFESSLANVRGDIAAQQRGERHADDPERFGQHLHTLEDIGFAEAPGPHMRHDPGRPVQRILSPTIGILGMTLSSSMLIIAIPLFQSSMSTGGKVALGILVIAVGGFGVYMIVLAVRVGNIGHPSYRTERGEESTSFSHAADRAPSDPIANTNEMLRVYGLLKEYARARYGQTRSDDPGAAAAIQQAVRADSACLVSNFANQRPFDINGVRAASYIEILGTRRADRWTGRDMDVTLPSGRGDWRYTGSPGITAVCR